MSTSSPFQWRQQWQRSITRRFLVWFTRWKNVRKIVFPLVAFITLVVLFVAEENWRGHRNWERYAKSLAERGEPVHFADIIPDAVPDDQNFAALPLFRSVLNQDPVDSVTSRPGWISEFDEAVTEESRIRADADRTVPRPGPRFVLTDLVAMELAYRNVKFGETNRLATSPPLADRVARARAGAALLEMLESLEPELTPLRQAIGRPYSRFDIDYHVDNPAMVLLPHLSVIKGVCRALKYKAAAELAVSRPERALKDLQLMLRVADSLKSEPILISYLVRVACLHQAVSVVWEGLATEAWTEAQLGAIPPLLARYDLVNDLKSAFQGERAFGNGIYDYLRNDRARTARMDEEEFEEDAWGPTPASLRLMPSGWLYMEQLNSNLLFDRFVQPQIAPSGQRMDPSQCEERSRQLEEELTSGGMVQAFLSHKALARLLLPALMRVPVKGVRIQADLDMARVACALMRFRLRQERWPETLAALTPGLMNQAPNDVVSDQPYRYRLLPEGGFVLYSVGWNEKDENGQVERTPEEGDWVWTEYSR